MANIMGWIFWGVLVFFAISFSYCIFCRLKARRLVTYAIILQTASLWIIAITFFLTDWNKLHLIWLAPLVFLIEVIIFPSLFGGIHLKYSVLRLLKMLKSKNDKEFDKLNDGYKNNDGDNLLISISDPKIKRTFAEIANSFFRPDFIDPIKFKANLEILKHQSRGIYKSSCVYRHEFDLSEKGTKTIDKFAFKIDRPLGFESWFISAYPDVIDWLQSIEDSKLLEILEDSNEEDMHSKNGKIKSEYLRKIVDAFIGSGRKLETAI